MTNSLKNMRDDLLRHQQEDIKSFGNIERMLESNTAILERHDAEFAEMKKMIQSIAEESKPVNQWFQNVSYTKATMLWVIGVVGAIIAIIIGIKQILSK